jgi:hypothetical protein
VQRFLDGAAFLVRSVPLLLLLQKSERSVCVINSVKLCGVKARNTALFVKLDPFLVIVISRHQALQ